VLASPAAAAVLGKSATKLTAQEPMGPLSVRVGRVLASTAAQGETGTPAEPGDGAYLVMASRPLPGPDGQPAPQTLLLAGRELTLARLTTMGHDRPIRLVLTEAMPAVLAAAAAGLACALALPWLVGPALDLSVFTGTGTPVPLRPDWAALGLPAAALVVIAALALAAETRALRRRGVTGALRAH
jgi:hypothetical protein